jgi:hypothetical protein
MTPADQGLFSGVALIVDAVMSSAFLRGEWSPPALMLSAGPLPNHCVALVPAPTA